MLRIARLTTLVVAGALVLGGCAANGEPGNGGTLEGEWVLNSGADASGALDLTGAQITLTIGDADTSGGRAPCNSYGATINGGPPDVSITVGAVTEMACVDERLMILETRYLAALGGVRIAEQTADELVLSGEGVELNYSILEPEPVPDLTGTVWQLDSLIAGPGPDGTASSTMAESTLVFGDRIEGHTGCRAFSADYSLDRTKLTISNLIADDVESCPDGAVEQENHILAVLDGTILIEPDGQQLTLTNPATDTALVYFAP